MVKRKKEGAPRVEAKGLRARIEELEETLRAIRMGEVDAVLVAGPQGDQVFTLQGAEHPYRLMVETIDEGAAMLATDGTVLYANKSFAEIFNASLEKFIGSALSLFVMGEDRELLDTLVSDANADIVRGEIRLDTNLQRPRTIRLTLSPVSEGAVRTICVVATELTALIETNEALRISELSLRQLSARLLKLQDEERRRIARDLHDTTGQKIAVLSMTLDRLAKSIDQKNEEAREGVVESREVLASIGEEIRTLSYLLHPPLLDECGLASAVHWYAEGFQRRSGIKLQVKIDDNLVRLSTDAETALFRVLQESLTNVHRYSGSSNAEIRIFEQDGAVHLEVIDFGKGLKAAPEKFAATGLPSLGVGIPGMRERLRQIGGQLEVEFGTRGTRVIAALPVEAGGMEALPLQGSRRAERREEEKTGGRKRILIADDHEVVRSGLRGLLEAQSEWAICGEALEGLEAVRLAEELQPDILILDVNMPGVSGIEAASQILKKDPEAKIIFFTVHDSPQMVREISNAGAHGYVSKSRASNDLVNAVRAVLSGERFFPKVNSAN